MNMFYNASLFRQNLTAWPIMARESEGFCTGATCDHKIDCQCNCLTSPVPSILQQWVESVYNPTNNVTFAPRNITYSHDSLIKVTGDKNYGECNPGHIVVSKYVSDGEYEEVQSIIGPSGCGNGFGQSVALSSSGQILAVGSIWTDFDSNNQGSVYIYERDEHVNGTYSLKQRIDGKCKGGQASNNFGAYIAMSSDGSLMVVSARYESDGAGGLHFYYRDNNGSWMILKRFHGNKEKEQLGNFGVAIEVNNLSSSMFVYASSNIEEGSRSIRAYKVRESYTKDEYVHHISISYHIIMLSLFSST